jgi:hypothetical protein
MGGGPDSSSLRKQSRACEFPHALLEAQEQDMPTAPDVAARMRQGREGLKVELTPISLTDFP